MSITPAAASFPVSKDGRNAAEQQLLVARARAIQAYAGLEQSLCSLFAAALGTPHDYASAVFFRIVNTRSRNEVISTLLRKRYPDRFHAYWDSMFKIIRVIDQKRNEIVHWHMASQVDHAGIEVMLVKPNFWDFSPTSPAIRVDDLDDFIARCDFASRSINIFNVTMLREASERPSTWLQIFQQPAVYPVPSTHPLYRTPQAP